LNDHSLSVLQRSTNKCASYDSSDAAQNERAINREARFAESGWGTSTLNSRASCAFNSSTPLPVVIDVRTIAASPNGVSRVGRGPFPRPRLPLQRGQFRERDDDVPHPEINQNLQMLFRLRHPAVVSRDNEQREIDRADARDHVLDEILVSGTSTIPMLSNASGIRSFKLRKTQLNRDAPQLSSGRRSGSVPVSARTSALLP